MLNFKNSIDKFVKVAESQERKGIEKYGQRLDPLDNKHDFLEMALEEQVDGFKYLHAEINKRKYALGMIRGILSEKVSPETYRELDVYLKLLEGWKQV